MPEVFDVEVTGIDEFVRKLDLVVNKRAQRSILIKTLRTGTQPVKKKMRQRIRSQRAVLTKALAKSIREKVKGYPSGVVVAIVGPRSRKVNGINPARYAHLVDKGTQPHRMTKPFLDKRTGQWKRFARGLHLGALPKPFLNFAARVTRNEVNTKMPKRFYDLLAAELKKQRV